MLGKKKQKPEVADTPPKNEVIDAIISEEETTQEETHQITAEELSMRMTEHDFKLYVIQTLEEIKEKIENGKNLPL